MKTYKKILMGALVLMCAMLGLNVAHRTIAATPPDNKYLSDCVLNIVAPGGNANLCKVDDPNGFLVVTYGGLEANEDLKRATYKGSSTLDNIASNGVTLQVPRLIEILDSTGQNSLFSGDLASKSLACGTLTHSSLVGNTQDQNGLVKEPYIVYTASGTDASCNHTTFLVSLNTDGSLQLLSAVDDTIQKGNFVYAANINKPIQGANAVTGTTGSANQGDDTSKCVASGSTTLEWILCPITTAIGKFVDVYIGAVEGQLKFPIDTYLPNSDDPNVGQTKLAWNIVRDIVSGALVIVLLVMVISQAMGGGPFEAYTIRKMLPRIIIAVIFMQISWYLCRYLIGLANDLGEGVKQIILAPFGSAGNMDLNSLLHHLNGTYALATTAVGFTAFLIAMLAFGGFILPVLALAAFTAAMAILVGLASILFRNILIVLLVIFSPLALMAWVFPGQSMQGYWKKWSNNFTKLLLLFPLMMAMIYGGRVVAWIAGNLGVPGFLDYAMVLIGFFGPLFLLPKAFKWGGEWMASASNAISSNAAITKVRGYGGKEIKEMINRKSGEQSQYNPYDKTFGRAVDSEGNVIPLALSKSRFMPKRLRGKELGAFGKKVPTIGGRAITRAKSGSIMPTDRGRALTTRKYENYKKERDEEQRAYNDAAYQAGEKGLFNGNRYSLNKDGSVNADPRAGKTGVGSAKDAVIANLASSNPRLRKTAMEKLADTQSFIEFQHNLVELDPRNDYQSGVIKDLEAKGHTLFERDGKKFARIPWMAEFEGIQENSPEYWRTIGGKRPDLNPPVTQGKYPAYISQAEVDAIPDSDARAAKQKERNNSIRSIGKFGMDESQWQARAGKVYSERDRMINAITDSYVQPSNVGNLAQGYYQEIARLQDPTLSAHFANLLASTVKSGQAGLNQLIGMQGPAGSSLAEDLNAALKPVGIKFEQYIEAARNNSEPPTVNTATTMSAADSATAPSRGGAQQGNDTAQQPRGRQQTSSNQASPTVVNQNEGTLVIQRPEPQVVQLQPGEGVSPGGVVLTRGAQEELSSQFESMRREMRDLKRMGVRNLQQQQRLEELQANHPDWRDDEDQPENT